MNELGRQIRNEQPEKDELLVYWLGGAGFIFKSPGLTVGLDLYLSDACQSEKGEYKRLVPPLVTPDELDLDYLIATHDHGDHLDTGSLKTFMGKNTKTRLLGPGTVIKIAKETFGIDEKRLQRLDRNEKFQAGSFAVQAVFADHGELSPDAIGVILDIGGRRIYFTGDTCFRVDMPQLVPLGQPIDLLLVPINGKYGNPDSKDASYITSWVKPGMVIPCHYWMFREHGGDPGEFFSRCSAICPSTKIYIPAIGEKVRL
jgi:L-ascorbate 6-phosphate lactonase